MAARGKPIRGRGLDKIAMGMQGRTSEIRVVREGAEGRERDRDVARRRRDFRKKGLGSRKFR